MEAASEGGGSSQEDLLRQLKATNRRLAEEVEEHRRFARGTLQHVLRIAESAFHNFSWLCGLIIARLGYHFLGHKLAEVAWVVRLVKRARDSCSSLASSAAPGLAGVIAALPTGPREKLREAIAGRAEQLHLLPIPLSALANGIYFAIALYFFIQLVHVTREWRQQERLLKTNWRLLRFHSQVARNDQKSYRIASEASLIDNAHSSDSSAIASLSALPMTPVMSPTASECGVPLLDKCYGSAAAVRRPTIASAFSACCRPRTVSPPPAPVPPLEKVPEEIKEEAAAVTAPATEDTPLPAVSTWRLPLYTRFVVPKDAEANNALKNYQLPPSPLPWNGPRNKLIQEFETPLFKGRLLLRAKGLPYDDEAQAYFMNRKRVQQVVIQGQFKRAFRFDEIWSGQIFPHEWRRIPRTVMAPALKAVRLLNPSMAIDFSTEHPFFIARQITSYQRVNVAKPGMEPDMLRDIPEDCSLIGPLFDNVKGDQAAASFRKKHFSLNLEELKKYSYNPDYVYTFENYQDLFYFNSFTYKIPLINWSLHIYEYLQGMPIEIACLRFRATTSADEIEEFKWRSASVPYLWRIQIYHKESVKMA